MLGDPRWLGWTVDTSAAADLYDLIAALISGLGGKKLPASSRYVRPTLPSTGDPNLAAPTIAEFNVSGFLRKVHE
jgi:hypothetical protein